MALQKGSTQAFVNVLRDDALKLQALLSVWVFQIPVTVFGCVPPVLTGVCPDAGRSGLRSMLMTF